MHRLHPLTVLEVDKGINYIPILSLVNCISLWVRISYSDILMCYRNKYIPGGDVCIDVFFCVCVYKCVFTCKYIISKEMLNIFYKIQKQFNEFQFLEPLLRALINFSAIN